MEDKEIEKGLSTKGKGPPEEAVSDFVISLIQAFLRTGYYLPAHPESKKAKAGLYEKFLDLTGDAGEIAFLVRDEGERKTIYIEGIGEKAISFSGLMTKGMAETYNPRFVNFLERKEMISLSLNSKMDPEEFSRFIDIMSEPSMMDMREHSAKEKFVKSLKERGIYHLSFIFNEDFITARRNIPWRACMALSRLKKDFRMIPIFRDLEEDKLKEVRREVLMEIMRPLAAPDLIYAFLMNIDLAATDDLEEKEGEDEVLSIAREDVLVDVAGIFIDDASGHDLKYRDVLGPEKFNRVLGKLAIRLNQINTIAAKLKLEKMFTAGLLSVEDLPPEVRESVMTIHLAVSFIDKRDKYLKHMDKTTDGDEYSTRARWLARIIPYLLERGRCEEAVSIVEKLLNHGREQSDRAIIALETLGWLAKGSALEMARRAFLKVPKEERIFLSRFFTLTGQWSVPHLVRIINESDDPWRKKQAVEVLLDLGPDAAAAILYEMARGSLPPEAMATVVRVLGESVDEQIQPAIIQALKKKADDEDDRVRCEVINAFCRLNPTEHYDLFMKKLADPDQRIRKYAIRGLGLSADTRAFESLEHLIRRAQESGLDEDWDLAAAAIEALGLLYTALPDGRDDVAAYLLALADIGYPKGLKKLVGRTTLPLSAQISLTEALGRIGGPEARDFLMRLSKDRERSLSRRAVEVLKKMES